MVGTNGKMIGRKTGKMNGRMIGRRGARGVGYHTSNGWPMDGHHGTTAWIFWSNFFEGISDRVVWKSNVYILKSMPNESILNISESDLGGTYSLSTIDMIFLPSMVNHHIWEVSMFYHWYAPFGCQLIYVDIHPVHFWMDIVTTNE